MRFISSLFIFLFSVMFVTSINASTTTLTAAQQLQVILSEITSMQAGFEQIIRDEDGYELQRSSGEMSLKRPGKFRWYIEKPMEQLVVADGKKLWFYDRELKQVIIQSMASTLGQTPASFLITPTYSFEKDYRVRYLSKERAFLLTPKAKEAPFQSIQFSFEGNVLKQMQLIDSLEQKTSVVFSTVRVNQYIDPRLFRFVPPKGVDIIDQSDTSP